MGDSKKILITGASGLIGTRLTTLLLDKGYEVAHLSRSGKNSKVPVFIWDVDKQTMDHDALRGVDTIIHLAGAGVVEKRWTAKRKKEILESRTHSTQLLYEVLKTQKHQVKNFISASAIGYYGFEDDREFTEEDPAGKDFLADVTAQWEREADKIGALGIRLVKVRIGIVLSPHDGALKPMVNTVRWWIGAPLGSGDQYISWIHIDDVCGMILYAAEHANVQGPVNAVATQPVTNRDLTKAIAKTLQKPLVLPPVPGFVIAVMLGEMGKIVLNGNRVSSRKIQQLGYRLKFDDIEKALDNLLKDQ